MSHTPDKVSWDKWYRAYIKGDWARKEDAWAIIIAENHNKLFMYREVNTCYFHSNMDETKHETNNLYSCHVTTAKKRFRIEEL